MGGLSLQTASSANGPQESERGRAYPPESEVYPVHHLPMLKAYAAHLGLVGLINPSVPTEMDVDAGTVVLGLVLDTLRGRSPRSRLEEFFAHQDTELLLGKACAPQALTADPVGRVLDRRDDFGTRRLLTAWAVRAATRLGLERRSVPFDTTSRRVWGASQLAETQDLPCQGPSGYSQEKRPDLQPLVLSTLGVDRAVPIWGKRAEGKASDKSRKTTRLSESAQRLASHGVAPGAYSSMAAAALGTADQLAALRDPVCIPRFPATSRECAECVPPFTHPVTQRAAGLSR